jgi:glycosidase
MKVSGTAEAVLKGDSLEVPLQTVKAYAFIRYTGNQRLLIVANFDRDQPVIQELNVPENLLKGHNIPQTIDLLTGTKIAHTNLSISLKVLPGTAQIIEF